MLLSDYLHSLFGSLDWNSDLPALFSHPFLWLNIYRSTCFKSQVISTDNLRAITINSNFTEEVPSSLIPIVSLLISCFLLSYSSSTLSFYFWLYHVCCYSFKNILDFLILSLYTSANTATPDKPFSVSIPQQLEAMKIHFHQTRVDFPQCIQKTVFFLESLLHFHNEVTSHPFYLNLLLLLSSLY